MLICQQALAQDGYRYSIDLKNVAGDRIGVQLQAPAMKQDSVDFVFPVSVPGYYNIKLKYGNLVSDLKAFDQNGQPLPVERKAPNRWTIRRAAGLLKLQYVLDDVWEVKDSLSHWGPAENIFDADSVFLLNNGATLGYFEGMSHMPVELSIQYPPHMYPASGAPLKAEGEGKLSYAAKSYRDITDYPILFTYTKPATFEVANAVITVSAYSETGKIKNDSLVRRLKPVITNIAAYLGNRLPADRYAFLLYFYAGRVFAVAALEHSTSSVYIYPENWDEKLIRSSFDEKFGEIAYHEFFHILAPLNIHSEELLNFNFTNPSTSQHLWLYEGMTEYLAYHAQVSRRARPLDTFCRDIEKFISEMKEYRSDVSLTTISSNTYGELHSQYDNVELKGVLVNLLLDIKLCELSQGKYSARQLMLDLAAHFGKDSSFRDNKLFDIIAGMTFPGIRRFFTDYVEGTKPLPLKEYLHKAGLIYDEKENRITVDPHATKQQLELRNYWLSSAGKRLEHH
jgi:predicted metalloprotease with PDZ domain